MENRAGGDERLVDTEDEVEADEEDEAEAKTGEKAGADERDESDDEDNDSDDKGKVGEGTVEWGRKKRGECEEEEAETDEDDKEDTDDDVDDDELAPELVSRMEADLTAAMEEAKSVEALRREMWWARCERKGRAVSQPEVTLGMKSRMQNQ